ncbi:MAG: Calcium-translocating P-type ATPase, PMCA-type [Parcubacteria group bacterium GW2011_GWA1_53_13]|nr:MAG: Calcium-translocating P-type ATPase, PMCA-type [Parcubacteria group bacterium GW2011_GWA1_53_13]
MISMDYRKGLSEEEARKRLSVYGRNEVKVDEGRVWVRILFGQVKSPLVYVLLIASGVSLLLGDVVDAGVIFLAVLINTVFGFFQEYRAEKSMEAFSKLLTPKARVKRGDEWKEIDASLLVPGDVVKLTIGWKVPADGLLIVEDDMYLGEAILTGESMPVAKKAGSEVYMGTVVEKGVGEMLVVQTGSRTKMGGIAKVVRERGIGRTPLQKRLDRLTGQLTVFIYGVMTGNSFLTFLNTSVALAVAAIPEGLVVGLTVILAVGMKRILKRKAIVRGLMAAETLGSVSVICLDKTGTITEGKMAAVGAVTDIGEGTDEQIADEGKHDEETMRWLIEGAFWCNDQRDPLEISMRDWAVLRLEKRLGKDAISRFVRKSELPFAHETKYIATRHEVNNKVVDFVSGAPEVVLERCSFKDEKIRKKWGERFVEVGITGYRMVAVAMRKREAGLVGKKIEQTDIDGLTWLGLMLFSDPLRGGVAESLSRAMEAGIKLKVITGDYKETGWAAVRQVGLVEGHEVKPDLVMLGEDFDKLSGEEKKQKILNSVLFARMLPEQKYEIVETLQANGETVAMMGDGVNDVPALKKADIGIVVEDASDLAREVADLILLDNNFDTILAAVEEGRGMFDNLRKVTLFLLSDSFAAIVVVLASIYLGWPLPLLASQILWINLISDGFPYMALTVEPKEKDLLARKPIARNAPLMEWKRVALVGVISVTAGGLALAVFGFTFFYLHKDIVFSRTMAFAMQGISSLVYVFSSRSLSRPIWKDNLLKNPFLNLGVLGGLVLQATAIYWPPLQGIFSTVAISLGDWLWLFGGGLLLIVVVETIKAAYFRNGYS